jgi:hypothetical protein
MRRSVIAGFLVVVSVSGCASMKGTSTSEGSRAARVPVPPDSAPPSVPPPAAAPPSKPESPTATTNAGADQSSTPAETADGTAPQPPPVSPTTRSGPAKPKSSTDPRQVKQAGTAAHAGPPGSPATPPAPASAATSGQAPAPSASPTLNLADLEQRLRQTSAIGVFTKLSLKNQVDDLLNAFRTLYRGPNKHPTVELRQRYDLLLLKVLTLLQDGDPPLAAAISSSREAIWSILSDPDKFAKI